MVPMAWAMAMARGLLMPMPGTVMAASMATDLGLVTDMVAWAMAMARGLLMPMPMPGTVMVASMAMDSQPMVPMEDMAFTERRRGLLMLMPKPSHGTVMVASMAMDSQPMVPMVWAMVMAR